MLRIQSLLLSARCTRFALVLLFVTIAGLLPAVALASSPEAGQLYNGYRGGGRPGHGCATYYYVHRGDTLSRIAARKGVSVYAIARVNHIPNIHRIYPGQYLCIPGHYKDDRHYDYGKDDGYHKMYGTSYDYGKYDDYDKPGYYDKYHDYGKHGDYGKHHDYDKYGNHDGYGRCGYHGGTDCGYDDYKHANYYHDKSGYYQSTGGHTGVRYYPDPRYSSANAYDYGDKK